MVSFKVNTHERALAVLERVLDENYAVLEAAVSRMPGVNLVPLESTYLPWLDCPWPGA